MASMRKLPSGRYRVRWRDDSGRERGVTVPTRKAALQAKSRVEVDAVGGLVRDPRLGRRISATT